MNYINGYSAVIIESLETGPYNINCFKEAGAEKNLMSEIFYV
jgi:hypothetical protein